MSARSVRHSRGRRESDVGYSAGTWWAALSPNELAVKREAAGQAKEWNGNEATRVPLASVFIRYPDTEYIPKKKSVKLSLSEPLISALIRASLCG